MSFKREESLATLCHRKGRLSRDFNYASTTQLCPRKRPFSISNYDSFDPFLICREIFRLTLSPVGGARSSFDFAANLSAPARILDAFWTRSGYGMFEPGSGFERRQSASDEARRKGCRDAWTRIEA